MTDSHPTSEKTTRWPGKRSEPKTENSDELPTPIASWRKLLDAPAENDEIGRLSRYRILGVLGQGGMGIVFQAEDPLAGRQIALKVMLPSLADDAELRQRFLREAQAMAAIEHDHVISIYHVDEAELTDENNSSETTRRVPFLAMPLLQGQTLAGRLRQGPLGAWEAVRVAREMALGLSAAHAKGLIHRDVKPSNVWLDEESGRVKILDFGLARFLDKSADGMTDSRVVLGTPKYMAPEQADGFPPEPRCDLFSMGVVMYEMVTGKQAFDAPSVMSILKKVTTYQPPPAHRLNPNTPAALSDLIDQLMSKNREDRPVSAEVVAHKLERIETSGPAPTKPVAVKSASARKPKWQGWATAFAAIAVLTGLVTVGVTVWRQPASPLPLAPPTTQNTAPTPTIPAAQSPHGYIDIQIWPSEAEVRAGETGKWLGAPGVLPLRAGNYVEARVEMTTGPVYMYVLWLESGGTAVPIYPWEDASWEQLPAHHPREVLRLPGPLGESPSGIETLLFLARNKPLTLSENQRLAKVFTGLPVQGGLPDPKLRMWLENGRGTRDRGAIQVAQGHGAAEVIGDLKQRLRSDGLQELFPYTRSVSFAFKGDKK